MKILLITGVFEPELGGPATYTVRLGKKLVALGHKVRVITYSDKPHFDFDKEYPFELIRVVRSPSKFSNYTRFFLVLLKNLRQFEVVYTLDWVTAGLPLCVASFLTHKKYGVRVGGGYIWEKYLAEGRPGLPLKDFYEKGIHHEYPALYNIIKLVLRRATFIVFNSVDQAELYQKFYGLTKEQTKTIPNSTPESLDFGIQRDETKIRKEIIFAGRYIKMKNVEATVEAFARLKDHEYKLILIGEGPTEEGLRQMVKDLGIESRVAFEPPMRQKDLYTRSIQSKYIILTSWTDISPNQVYECLVLNIPFLITKENYLTINSEDFLKTDPRSVEDIAEKMNSLLDEGAYQKFCDRLRQIKFSFTWDQSVEAHLKLFETIKK